MRGFFVYFLYMCLYARFYIEPKIQRPKDPKIQRSKDIETRDSTRKHCILPSISTTDFANGNCVAVAVSRTIAGQLPDNEESYQYVLIAVDNNHFAIEQYIARLDPH